jgi:diadenylate cyclase
VSQSMRTIGLYLGGSRFVVEGSAAVLSRANQALDTLERYKARLEEVSNTLFALEIEDLVTVRDAAGVLQRLEMVLRIEDEISRYEVELGIDGRLLALQLEELMAGVRADRDLLVRDYLPSGRRAIPAEAALEALDALDSNDLLDLVLVAEALGYPATIEALDIAVSPRGYRMLSRVPRLPSSVLDRVVEQFSSLQKLLAATAEDLQQVEGVGEARARGVRESLSRLADASIVDRYA